LHRFSWVRIPTFIIYAHSRKKVKRKSNFFGSTQVWFEKPTGSGQIGNLVSD
jgi:hypothetical protein